MKLHSYNPLVKHRQIDALSNTEQDSTITRIGPKSVSIAFMPLKTVFSSNLSKLIQNIRDMLPTIQYAHELDQARTVSIKHQIISMR